jgi:uncharacterized protein YcfJ
MLKRMLGLIVIVGLVYVTAGCETMGENTKRGAVGGALLGSIAGGVIGHQSGHGIEGALIGGTVGAVSGAVIGDKIDARSKDTIMTSGEKLGISDVIVLAKSGMTDDAIIDKIAKTGSVYVLSVEEIEALKKEGVSNRVVNYMMESGKK